MTRVRHTHNFKKADRDSITQQDRLTAARTASRLTATEETWTPPPSLAPGLKLSLSASRGCRTRRVSVRDGTEAHP